MSSPTSLFPSTFTSFTHTTDPTTSPPTIISGLKGPGSGPPLLLIHGFPQTHVIWHKVAPALSEFFTLVLIDLRGYGDSSKPTSGVDVKCSQELYTKKAMAQDCVNVMAHLFPSSGVSGNGAAKFFVLAHDRGARVAHYLLVHHALVIRKAILLDICPTKATYDQTTQRFAQAYWHWFFLTQPSPFPEEVIASAPLLFARKMLRGDQSFFNEDAYGAYEEQLGNAQGVRAMCDDYRAAAKEDCQQQGEDEAEGRKIAVQVRVLWGKHGVCEAMFDVRKEWDAASESGMLDEGSRALDCGHYIAEEVPEQVIAEAKAFFEV